MRKREGYGDDDKGCEDTVKYIFDLADKSNKGGQSDHLIGTWREEGREGGRGVVVVE